MSGLYEVLITCDSNNTLWTCSIWDPHTGTNLMTYKGGGTAESRTLSIIGQDYLSSIEKTKPILHVWPLNSHQTVQGVRFVLPGKATAFAVSPDGNYCIAGIEEKVYIWQISSGSLLTIINRHYQKVIQLKFTADGNFFISAAEDGMVMVWSLAAVTARPEIELVTQSTAGQHDPLYILSDHSLPVTDICVSKTGINGRLYTVSSDRTCKIYDLPTGEMLLNLVFDAPLSSACTDIMELSVFVGTTDGKIHQFSLMNPPRNKDHLVSTEKECPTLTFHSKAVTCLSPSLDGETLMSASNDETVVLWHIHSQQPIRTIRHKGAITNAYFSVNIPAIYEQNFSPSIILHSFERTLEKDIDEELEMEILVKEKINFWPDHTSEDNYDSNNYEIKNNSEYIQKEAALKEEIEKLKKINANLYEFTVKKTLTTVSNKVPNGNVKSKKKKKK